MIICGPVVTSMAAAVVTQSGAPINEDVNKFTAFAGMGAAIGILFCFMLMDKDETRKQVAARIIVGGLSGIVLPRIGNKYFGFVHEFLLDPILVIGAGFACTFLAYFLIYSLARRLAGRERAIAAAVLKQAEKKARIHEE